MLLAHGSADRITAAEGSRAFVERAGSGDKSFRLYEGAWHGLLLDDVSDRVVEDVLDWIEARLGKSIHE